MACPPRRRVSAAAHRPDPIPVRLLDHGADGVAGRAQLLPVLREDAFLVVGQAAGQGPDPEAAIPGRLERRDVVVPEGPALVVVGDELAAVVAGQPLLGAEPEIAVRALIDGVDRVLGQSVTREPGLEDVLGHRPAGVECQGR